MTNGQPWTHLVSTASVVGLHKKIMARYGGEASSTASDCVEARLGNAWNAGLYREPDDAKRGLCFAGHLLFYLVKDHCFTDGNKRVAWTTALQVLYRLGLTLNATTDEAEALINRVITREITEPDAVVRWFADRLVTN